MGRVGGSSEPGLARSPRPFQTVTATQAIRGDLPEDGEHGVPDSVCQRGDVIWSQPFCGHWGQHPHMTSPWWDTQQHHGGLAWFQPAVVQSRYFFGSLLETRMTVALLASC